MASNAAKSYIEAAKAWARRMLTPEGLTEEEINLARAYLDAMARLDKATELLRELSNRAHASLMTGDMPEEGVDTSTPLADAMHAAQRFLDERK